MKEYKIISPDFSWTKSKENFEQKINNYAKQGWRVVNIYVTANNRVQALIERDKNR